MNRVALMLLLAVVASVATACVETYDGLFANPCEDALEIAVYYGAPQDLPADLDDPPVIEAELEPLAITRVPDAFDDPQQSDFTVVVLPDVVRVGVSRGNRRDAAQGDMMVALPASAC